MHRREWAKPTATGPLALAVLANSELRIQGHREHPLNFRDLQTEHRRTLLLYPGEESRILSRSLLAEDTRPSTWLCRMATGGRQRVWAKGSPGLNMR